MYNMTTRRHTEQSELDRKKRSEEIKKEIRILNLAKKFTHTISEMTKALNTQNSLYSIDNICQTFKINQRRFSDIINVLQVVGVLTKIDHNTIEWFGIDKFRIRQHIKMLCEQDFLNVFNEEVTLRDIFPKRDDPSGENSALIVGIQQATWYFISLFVGLNMKKLDAKEVSFLFAYDDIYRQKIMLNKLGVIGNILTGAGILTRVQGKPYTFIFNDDFFVSIPFVLRFPDLFDEEVNPFSIISLLNDPVIPDFIKNRRREYRNMVSELKDVIVF